MSAGPISLLLVEDDPGDVVLLREGFSGNAAIEEIRVVTDGVDALDTLRDPNRTLPDLVVLDLNLPRKDGREVLAEIRADPELTHLPIVVLSTSDAHGDVMRSYELHANAYIAKPVELGRFLDVVREIDSFFLSAAELPPRA